MSRKIVAWVEPGENDEAVHHWCSVAEAIRRQKASAGAHGVKYTHDNTALMDFLTINWAGIYESTPFAGEDTSEQE